MDVRIIAATNSDLPTMVAEGRFREDLFYRLNVINLELPSLRSRGEDVVLLSNFFLQKYNEKNGKQLAGFTPGALEVMAKYAWPGNVRELENAIERAVVLSKDTLVDVDVLPNSVVMGRQRTDTVNIPVGTTLRDAEMQLIRRLSTAPPGTRKRQPTSWGSPRAPYTGKCSNGTDPAGLTGFWGVVILARPYPAPPHD